jgi:hypothetical protein
MMRLIFIQNLIFTKDSGLLSSSFPEKKVVSKFVKKGGVAGLFRVMSPSSLVNVASQDHNLNIL